MIADTLIATVRSRRRKKARARRRRATVARLSFTGRGLTGGNRFRKTRRYGASSAVKPTDVNNESFLRRVCSGVTTQTL